MRLRALQVKAMRWKFKNRNRLGGGANRGEPCEGNMSHTTGYEMLLCFGKAQGNLFCYWTIPCVSSGRSIADRRGPGERMSLDGSVWAGWRRRGSGPSCTGKMLPHLRSQHVGEAFTAGDDDLHIWLCISKPRSPPLLPMKTGSNCTHCRKKFILFPEV